MNYKASERYSQLTANRAHFLDTAVECSKLTLPYLVQQDVSRKGTPSSLKQPWQSVGAKGVVTLAAKLMLSLLPPQTSFFKLQVEESKLGEMLDPIADKILVASALVLLVMTNTIKNYEVIAAIIILTREILISGLREFLAIGKIKLPVSNLAKLKTFLQMFSISILLTGETGNKIINFQDYNAQTIGIILLWFSAFLTLYTGYDYLRKGIDHAISEDEKN